MIKKILSSIFILLYFIITSVVIVCFTHFGLKLSLSLASYFLPGKLTIEKVQGTLWKQFYLENLRYEQNHVVYNINSLTVSWQPEQLLNKSFNVLITADLLDGNLTVKARYPLFSQQRWNFFIRAHQLNPGKLSLTWPGTINFELQLSGVQQQIQQIQLQKLFGDIRHIPLQGNIDIEKNGQEFNINQAQVSLGSSYIHFIGKIGPKSNLNWSINIKNLSNILLNSKGQIYSTGKMSGDYLNPTILTNIRANNIQYEDYTIRYLAANLIADSKKQKLDLTVTSPVANIQLNLLSHKIQRLWQATIQKLVIKTHQYGSWYSLGTANFDLNDTNPSGEMNLTSITGSIPNLNLNISIPSFLLQISKDKILSYSAKIYSGQGPLVISGQTDTKNPDFASEIKVAGNNFLLANSLEYKVYISPTLTINMTKQALAVMGSIIIPKASFTPKDFSSTVSLPSEVTIIQHNQPAIAHNFRTKIHIKLQLGKNIYLHYKGLDTYLSGSINLAQDPGGLLLATGDLATNQGNYTTFSKKLNIRSGHLTYTGGPISNPGLNIQAIKTISAPSISSANNFLSNQTASAYAGDTNLIIGINVQGTLENPVINLFSEPTSLSQADVLSYLILGYPTSQASGKDTQILLGALSAMRSGSSPVDTITQPLKKTFGLNELGIQSTQMYDPKSNSLVTGSSLVVGKKIAPKLYLQYSAGLFNQLYVLNLRYELSKKISLQTEASAIDTGGDIIYHFDKN